MSRPRTHCLTETHKRILLEIGHWRTSNDAVVISDLVIGLELAGASSVVPTLKVMERNGFIKILGGGGQGKRRTVALTSKGKAIANVGVPVLGSIPAGALSEAIEHCEEVVELGAALPNQPGDFFLVVSGHSMIGDGILPGDKVLLRPNVQVKNGEIAAVYFSEQYLVTLKHVCFGATDETVTLKASNKDYADIKISGGELQIAGVFRGLLRSAQF